MKNKLKHQANPTLLGTVQDVRGTTISVALSENQLSGLTFVNGQGYKIGQVGSFVKIPVGYTELFGIISEVGANAAPERLAEVEPYGHRWLSVQLVGEGRKGSKFQRGISQYPTIDDEVHLVSENDLASIYGRRGQQRHLVRVGHIAGAQSIDASVDINKLITRHSAIVGTTGSGKSTTVAGILSALSDEEKFPSARVVVLDLHGEYSKALGDRANIYKINPNLKSSNEKNLYLPFWAMSIDELINLTFGDLPADGKIKNIILERILEYKQKTLALYPKDGAEPIGLNVDSPVPFSLNDLWYDLYCSEFGTYYSKDKSPTKDNWAFETDTKGNLLTGDASKALPPKFKKVKNAKEDDEKINYLPDPLNIRAQIENLGAKLRLNRYEFLFKPGDWSPALDGKTEKDIDDLMQAWIGSEKPITILDLSGVPTTIINDIIGVLLRILYDALFWARFQSEGGRERPLLVVMEEAHSYLNDNFKGLASSVVQRIVKEGRKYGIGAMIVSQRPSEINSTILSQCGTLFALRLSNASDRSHVTSAITDNLESLTDMLPILRTGEAIIVGEAVGIPMRTIIEPPPKDRRPDSQDPVICDDTPRDDSMIAGGWVNPKLTKEQSDKAYDELTLVWRKQDPRK